MKTPPASLLRKHVIQNKRNIARRKNQTFISFQHIQTAFVRKGGFFVQKKRAANAYPFN